ncbi:hypothetical protein [Methanohalobium sp.]|uniref:hypothetical protein n=1 Tax=Methanohalobium sp. TaxID=2837493 RepID=UPI0025DAEEB3|nr:hypothetical protein [Methanohalobium sp.]
MIKNECFYCQKTDLECIHPRGDCISCPVNNAEELNRRTIENEKYNKKETESQNLRLEREGYIKTKKENGQLKIDSITEKGKKKLSKDLLDELNSDLKIDEILFTQAEILRNSPVFWKRVIELMKYGVLKKETIENVNILALVGFIGLFEGLETKLTENEEKLLEWQTEGFVDMCMDYTQ